MDLPTTGAAFRNYLEQLADALDVPESRYEEATARYKSIGEWLSRAESSMRAMSPATYLQGSFRLGTPIKPINSDEEYDIDIVCEVNASKLTKTQEQLKADLGVEVRSYAKSKGMNTRPADNRRCWTLNYADGAQFHADILPAIPDSERMRLLLETNKIVPGSLPNDALAITDKSHKSYGKICDDWNVSSPKGYAIWFQSRMSVRYLERRAAVAKMLNESVEAVPEYKVKTPLQRAVQILKRHRDLMFEADPEHKPISIIITTLAASSYSNEIDLADAYRNIIFGMDRFIAKRGDVWWIANPVNPLENFADKWPEEPKKERSFFDWIARLKADYLEFSNASNLSSLNAGLEKSFGRRVGGALLTRPSKFENILLNLGSSIGHILGVAHRRKPDWPMAISRSVNIEAVVSRHGFRDCGYQNNGPAINKHATIRFHATTNAEAPFKVFWQVVNTGAEAEHARALRGGFEEVSATLGNLSKKESTLYTGKHWVECFIVKDGRCIGRSREFVVNVE